MENEARIEYLAGQILYLNERHFLEDKSEVSDEEYDMMYAELKRLDPDNEVFNEVGARMDDVPDEVKVKHDRPMGSLAKALTVDEALAWAKQFPNTRILISRKMDGCAISVKYKDGAMVLAATRGDGLVGENVTENAKQIDDIPNTIPNFSGEIRGEVYMTWESFNKLVELCEETGKKKPVNPRNCASGSLRQFKHPEITKERGLSFVAYNIINEITEYETEPEKAAAADILGVPYIKFMEFSAEAFDKLTQDAADKRPDLPYCIDGLVLTIDDCGMIESLGMIGNSHCPKGAIAFKFPPVEAEARVNDITWQVGRTGKITPVAELEPTYVDGSTVSRATLHNHANIITLGLAIGDDVRFCKSGDIIPYIKEVANHAGSDDINYPAQCPSCGADTEHDDVNAVCINPVCPAQLDAKLLHWLRRLDVKGVGSANIAKFRNAGLLNSLSDLYRLDAESIEEITGGEKSAKKIIDAIAAVKDIPLWVFLSGLGIPELGRTTSKMVAKKYRTLFNVLAATKSELVELDGIGDITASHIVDGLQKMTGVIGELQGFVNVLDEVEKEGALKGVSVCITGKISMGKKAAHKMIEDAGGEAWTSVKKGLTYLVTDNPNGTSSKMKKAAKLGVEVIDEEKMMELISQ